MRARLVAVASVVAWCGAAAAMASGPSAQTQPATDVTATSATMNGLVNPDDKPTTYWFELGETSSYGTATAPTSRRIAMAPNRSQTAKARRCRRMITALTAR